MPKISKRAQRKKMSEEFQLVCRNYSFDALNTLVKIMNEGSNADRIKAAELILAYAHGKPSQAVKRETTHTTRAVVIIGEKEVPKITEKINETELLDA